MLWRQDRGSEGALELPALRSCGCRHAPEMPFLARVANRGCGIWVAQDGSCGCGALAQGCGLWVGGWKRRGGEKSVRFGRSGAGEVSLAQELFGLPGANPVLVIWLRWGAVGKELPYAACSFPPTPPFLKCQQNAAVIVAGMESPGHESGADLVRQQAKPDRIAPRLALVWFKVTDESWQPEQRTKLSSEKGLLAGGGHMTWALLSSSDSGGVGSVRAGTAFISLKPLEKGV